IRYTYHDSSEFHPIAKAFNTIFETNATAKVAVAYPPSNIWIENNSTNIRRPMKYFREDTFRLETTAQVYDHPSRTYVMKWNVDKITSTNDVIETINISTIRSSNCSALRFPARFLDVGLYKMEYTIDIYDNGSLEDSPTCFTYLEIVSGNLRPMMIKGGASYILRGHDQMVYLEVDKYSVDPDNPDDKEFQMEWSCRFVNAADVLQDDESYDEDASLSHHVVTPHHTEKIMKNEECFKESKSAKDLQALQWVFNTATLRDFNTLYEIEVILSKDSRREHKRIYLDIIKNNPPGITVMCEKSVACRVTEGGFIVNPSDWLAVRAECVTECGSGYLRYEWEIYGISGESESRELLDEWSSHVIFDEDRLGINKTFFKTYEKFQSFHIKVTGTDMDDDRPKGVAKLYIRTNIPPKPGSCTISSNTGMATVTIFQLDFEGWTDPDGEDLRDFSVYNLYDGKRFHVHYGVKTSAEFILPPGESKIMCAVKDEIGAITELYVDTVTASLPDNDTLEEWKSSINVEFFMVEGRMSIMAQAIASEAIVEEKEKEINPVSVASEVDKVWKEYWELSGIDSSFYTKEAREEIEAQLRDEKSGATEKEAEKNFVILQSLEILPFEVIDDSEVYGQAVSALAQTRPLNKGSKKLLTEFIEEMAESTFTTETAHPEDKTISNRLLVNVMNSLSKSLSEEIIGGNFLDSELEEAYEFYMYNITEPNFFILYVNGSRWEVEERVHMKKVEGAKNVSQEEVN
ncbi:polycystic kidney disease protein 1-like 2, partial [Trichonephila clavata]